ncbi:MAG: hypothetical protein KGI58_02070 [Patescibacteria group bacterium]|nr:hypothetical protein [Patescibacteria group bacterium]
MFTDLLNLNNFDLLIVGIFIAATYTLGFVVFFSNKKSITNKIFLLFSIITGIWGIINYFSYKFSDPYISLWLLRFLLLFAVLQAYYLYRLLLVFPNESYSFSKRHKYFLVPVVILTSLLTLSPFVFSGIIGRTIIGQEPIVQKGIGLLFFALVAVGLVVKAFNILIRKIINSKDRKEKRTYIYVLVGLVTMFILIIFFNLILSTVFQNPKFVPLGALFTFPFILFMSYAIFKQKLFNIKVAATAVLVFLLSVLLFSEIIFSTEIDLILFRSSIFVLFLIFGINLIRGVIREVEQKERLEALRLKLEESNLKLESANNKLKDLDKLKTEFLSLASHQLRSPLTAIKGYTSMVLEGDFGEINPQAKDAIDRVFQSTMNLTKIVEDLLNVSKIEQGGMKYEMAPFSVVEVARDMSKDLSVVAEKKGLKLTFESDNEEDCMVNGDKEKIRQVVLNFIDNSLKYTKEGTINVSVRKVNDKVVFAVKDTGMGMTPEIKATLFQKFSRGDGARMNTGGSGLGLYLAKEIIEAHKGTVGVDSEGMGKGSTFYFKLNTIKQ